LCTMPPKKPPEQRRDGVVETLTVTQTMRKDGKAALKAAKVTQSFRPHCAQPFTQVRHVELVEGHRHARRPHAVARAQGKKRITECEWADGYEPPDEWSEDEAMPDEYALEDTGWRAGPKPRAPVKFHGPTPGPTNEALTWDSTCTDIMLELITPEFKDQWAEFTMQHAVAWRAAHPGWKKNRIEQSAPSVPAMKKLLTHNAFDLWLACRLRCSQFKPEIDVSKLWDTKSTICG